MKVLSSVLLLHRSTYNNFVRKGSIRGFTQSTCLYLNRILVDSDDCIFADNGDITTQFNSSDYRYDHIKNILKLSPGDNFRSGVLNQGITDGATVVAVNEALDKKKSKSKQRRIESDKLDIGTSDTLANDDNALSNNVSHDIEKKNENTIDIRIGNKKDLIQPKTRPCVDLILAAPRPLRLERIIPIVSCLGIRHVAIIGANKVEKHFFGSQLMRRPDIMRLKLIEGLEQAEVDCFLPTFSIHKSFNQFIKFQLPEVLLSSSNNYDGIYNHDDNSIEVNIVDSNETETKDNQDKDSIATIDATSSSYNKYTDNNGISSHNDNTRYIKVITQPLYPTMTRVDPVTGDVIALPRSTRFSSIFQEEFGADSKAQAKNDNNIRVVVAIGPEGGWTYDELEAFIAQGFQLVHMGERILRTDIAVQTSLGIVNELLGYYLDGNKEDEEHVNDSSSNNNSQ